MPLVFHHRSRKKGADSVLKHVDFGPPGINQSGGGFVVWFGLAWLWVFVCLL